MYSQIIKEGFLNLGIVKIPNSTLKPFPKQKPLTNRGTFHKRLTLTLSAVESWTPSVSAAAGAVDTVDHVLLQKPNSGPAKDHTRVLTYCTTAVAMELVSQVTSSCPPLRADWHLPSAWPG